MIGGRGNENPDVVRGPLALDGDDVLTEGETILIREFIPLLRLLLVVVNSSVPCAMLALSSSVIRFVYSFSWEPV
jgi:hypothetical protein